MTMYPKIFLKIWNFKVNREHFIHLLLIRVETAIDSIRHFDSWLIFRNFVEQNCHLGSHHKDSLSTISIDTATPPLTPTPGHADTRGIEGWRWNSGRDGFVESHPSIVSPGWPGVPISALESRD